MPKTKVARRLSPEMAAEADDDSVDLERAFIERGDPPPSVLSQVVRDDEEMRRLLGTRGENNPRLFGRFYHELETVGGRLTDLRAMCPGYTWVLIFGLSGALQAYGRANGVFLPWVLALLRKRLASRGSSVASSVPILDIVAHPVDPMLVLVLMRTEDDARSLLDAAQDQTSYLAGKVALWDEFVVSEDAEDVDRVILSGLSAIVHFREMGRRWFDEKDRHRTERERLLRTAELSKKLSEFAPYLAAAAEPELKHDLPERPTATEEPIIIKDALVLLGVPRGMTEGTIACLFHNAMLATSRDFCPWRLKAVVFHSSLNHAALVFEKGTPLGPVCQQFNRYTSEYQIVAAIPYHTMYRYRDPFPKKRPSDLSLIEEWEETKDRFECINIPTSVGDTSNESMGS